MAFRPALWKCVMWVAISLLVTQGFARSDWDERQVSVVMRMIGHEVLLDMGDSVSRVMPIQREGEQYKISFENPFPFEPGSMVASIHRVIEKTRLTRSYQVEVINCDSGEVVYSYLVGNEVNMDVIPCQGRAQPAGCYELLFTPLDGQSYRSALEIAEAALDGNPPQSSSQGLPNRTGFVLMSLIGILALLGYVWQRNTKPSPETHIITIGAYRFNPRSLELSHKKETVELSSKEADLLTMLHDATNQTLEREQILSQVWGDDGDYVGRTLDVFISKLRKRLDADPNVKIVNVRGVGYKLLVDQ